MNFGRSSIERKVGFKIFYFCRMKKESLLYFHIFYWLIYTIGSIVIPYFVFSNQNIILDITFFITSFSCFYLNYFFVAPKFFDLHKLYKTIIGFFLSVLIFVIIRYFIEEWFLPQFFGIRNYAEGTGFGYYFFDNIYFSSNTIFISTVFWLFKKFLVSEKEKRVLVSEKKQAQLQALKTQINPHFIFNSLNNIYSLVYQKSEKALPALEELSQLLRFSTKDLEKDFIPLTKEIGYIESLVALERLRIKDSALLTIEKTVQHPELEISPMLLVPFIENAFKHGDFSEKGFTLKIKEENKVLNFHLHNYKKEKVKDSVSGIGIENVKKRLAILYPQHHLAITETLSEFVVNLEINLSNPQKVEYGKN